MQLISLQVDQRRRRLDEGTVATPAFATHTDYDGCLLMATGKLHKNKTTTTTTTSTAPRRMYLLRLVLVAEFSSAQSVQLTGDSRIITQEDERT